MTKLPGRRRGLLKGASLWMGPDYMLSVKSMRFREDYRRFYFRDVQAVAVARAPRFHISTRSLFLGAVWLALYGIASAAAPRYSWILWLVAAALVAAWIVVSARFSCRCRLYTAVSREELPSVYRTWTARKFLEQVTPRIAEVQGAVPENWAETAAGLTPAAASPSVQENSRASLYPNARVHTLAADLFIATLFLSALANLLLLHATSSLATASQLIFPLALLTESVVLFVQYYRGVLQSAMQKLAIANLIALGVLYYVRQLVLSFNYGATAQKGDLKIPTFYTGGALTRGIDAAVCIILGLVGLGIIFLRKERL